MSTREFEGEDLERSATHDPEVIARDIAKRHGLTVEDIKGPKRYAHVSAARKDLYRALRADLKWSFPQIGRFVGRRDHTTVMAGLWDDTRKHRQKVRDVLRPRPGARR